MNWIKLTDKKPPLNTSVWIARLDYSIYDPLYSVVIDVAKYALTQENPEKSRTQNQNQNEEGRFPYNDVTHWMPLTQATKHIGKSELLKMYVKKLNDEKSESVLRD